jgi:hypothetical protein
MIRPLEEQFARRKVKLIRVIQAEFQSIPYHFPIERYFAKELNGCLEAGLLLAAIGIAASLLEIFARNLLIEALTNAQTANDKSAREIINQIERVIEDDRPRHVFALIIKTLKEMTIIEESDAENIENFYKDIRIPIHHGITRRFVRGSRHKTEDEWLTLYLDIEFRFHRIEDVIENDSIKHLKTVAEFIRKYSRVALS